MCAYMCPSAMLFVYTHNALCTHINILSFLTIYLSIDCCYVLTISLFIRLHEAFVDLKKRCTLVSLQSHFMRHGIGTYLYGNGRLSLVVPQKAHVFIQIYWYSMSRKMAPLPVFPSVFLLRWILLDFLQYLLRPFYLFTFPPFTQKLSIVSKVHRFFWSIWKIN